MAATFVVVLLVAIGEGQDSSTQAAAASTRDALQGDAEVVVREVERPERLNDVETNRIATTLKADAVAIVIWREAQHRNVSLHVRSNRREWVDRSLSFNEGDPTLERGRMIGFEVASIISTPSPPPPPFPPPATATSHEQHGDKPPEPPTTGAPTKVAIDLLGVGVVGGGASGVGGDLAGRLWFLDRRLAARVGAGIRAGDVTEAGASLIVARAEAGLAVRLIGRDTPNQRGPFELGVRADVIALWYRLARADTASHGSYVAPGMTSVVEAGWFFVKSFAIVGDVGVEVAFANVRVFVDDRRTTSIDPLRGVAELGLRWEP